ncbi:MAG: transcriptional repressor [bacterium]|nr:transcriptional repressor [bacterium]
MASVKQMNRKEIDERVKTFTDLCRTQGLKVTHQRLEIYQALLETIGHPAAEDVYHLIRHKLPTVSIDTVYRTLALFEEHGLISRVQCLSDKGRFDSNVEPHHHFICVECKAIYDFYWPEFDRLLPPDSIGALGEVRVERAELRGVCKHCLKARTSSVQ